MCHQKLTLKAFLCSYCPACEHAYSVMFMMFTLDLFLSRYKGYTFLSSSITYFNSILKITNIFTALSTNSKELRAGCINELDNVPAAQI